MDDRDNDGTTQHGDTAATHEPGHRGVATDHDNVAPDSAPSNPPATTKPAMRPDEARPGAADARAQAEKIIKRNHDLIHGEAEASHEGERGTGVGHTVNSDTSHRGGDYASD